MWMPDLADASWMRAVLSECGDALAIGGPVEELDLLDVRLTHPHRPESPRCRGWATYLVRAGGATPLRLYVKGYPDAATAGAAWTDDHASRPQARSVHLRRHDVVVWPFPDDPRLPTLPALLAPEGLPALVPPAVRGLTGPDVGLRSTLVRYQPEVSVTVRIEPTGGTGATTFAKHLVDGAVPLLAERHEALWRASMERHALRIAEPLGADPEHRVLWTRGVAGDPLTTSHRPDRLAHMSPQVGALLAALHATPTRAPLVTVDSLVAEMVKKADKIAVACPAVGGLVASIASTAGRPQDGRGREPLVTLHGDFHLDQLVSSPAGPVLVDLDSMVRGVPEIDLAEFLVDLALRGLPSAVARDVAGGLMDAYRLATATAISEARLRLCADAEFLNRCYRHLRRHAPGWREGLAVELARHSDVVALMRF